METANSSSSSNNSTHNQIYIVSGALVVGVIITAIVQTRLGDDRTRKERSRVHSAAVYTTALLLWPIIIEKVVGFSRISAHPYVLGFGFVWAALLIAWELTNNMDETRSGAEARARSAETKNYAGVIIGAAWAVGTLLGAFKPADAGQSAEGSKVLLLSLILCIAFIVPLNTDSGDARTTSAVVLRSAQRSALHFSVGLFITGIGLSIV